MVRFPSGLRDQIKEVATAEGRSMNSEIIKRLEESFGREADGLRLVWLPPDLWERVEQEANAHEMDPNLVVVTRLERTFAGRQREIDFASGTVGDAEAPELMLDDLSDHDLLRVISRASELLRTRPTITLRRPWKKD